MTDSEGGMYGWESDRVSDLYGAVLSSVTTRRSFNKNNGIVGGIHFARVTSDFPNIMVAPYERNVSGHRPSRCVTGPPIPHPIPLAQVPEGRWKTIRGAPTTGRGGVDGTESLPDSPGFCGPGRRHHGLFPSVWDLLLTSVFSFDAAEYQ